MRVRPRERAQISECEQPRARNFADDAGLNEAWRNALNGMTLLRFHVIQMRRRRGSKMQRVHSGQTGDSVS